MNYKERQDWLKARYPLTVVTDRYSGTYSGAKFLAFPLDFDEVPEDVNGDDAECAYFWPNYAEPVGKGISLQEAIDNLVAQMQNEDKDEKIREEMIRHFQNILKEGVDTTTLDDTKRWLAWLEKRSEENIKKIRSEEYTEGYTDAVKAYKKWEKEQKPCLTCNEYDKGYKQGYTEGCTAGYNKAMKEQKALPGFDDWTPEENLPAGFYYIDQDGKKYYSKEFRYGDMKVKVGERKPLKVGETAYFDPNTDMWFIKKEQKPVDEKIVDEVSKSVRKKWALDFINYLDANRFEGKMNVSNAECKDIEEAFFSADWEKIYKYYNKYLQKPVEWSEDIIHKAIKEVGLTQHQIDWFKTNVFPPKQEWSEEDEENFKWFDKLFRAESVVAGGRDIPQDKYLWFKSLRPQPKWKPSEKQMGALLDASEINAYIFHATLKSLYADLKKLMEE